MLKGDTNNCKCAWCGEPVLPEQPKVPDDADPGRYMHLDCSCAIADGDDLERDLG